MHLTSRDGDWFLDELSTMCGNISQLLSVLKNSPLRSSSQKNTDVMENISNGMQIVFAAVKAYNSLQELMSNFRTIIVPEAVKSFLVNDPSVLHITEAIREMVEFSQINIQNLCENYRDIIKERSDLSEHILNAVNNLKGHLEQLADPEINHENDEGMDTSLTCFCWQYNIT